MFSLKKMKEFLKESARVLRITKKPNMKEFKAIIKVSGLGMAIIGGLGFLIQMIALLFK